MVKSIPWNSLYRIDHAEDENLYTKAIINKVQKWIKLNVRSFYRSVDKAAKLESYE